MPKKPLLSRDELDYIQQILGHSLSSAILPVQSFRVDGGSLANGILAGLGRNAQLHLEAQFGDQCLRFPLQLVEDDFHALHLELGARMGTLERPAVAVAMIANEFARARQSPEDVFDGLAKGKVKMGPYVNMPDDVKKLAEETEAALKSGKLDAFMCPVVAQDGKTVECKGGDRLTDEQVVGMNFYVQGIAGTIPK